MPLSVLKDKGWFVSENALDIELDLCDQADRLDNPQRLEEFLLNTDLKEIGNPILYEKFDRKKGELVGPIILQLTKWRNISYPSVSNHDKNDGICVLTLSDGHGSAKAFSIDALKIDGNTTYGSKILLSGKIRAESGFLMLNNRNTTLLGGNVESLVEKWKTEKFSGNERKSINAPRWVPFSKARNLNIKFDKNFSSLRQNADSAEKEVEEKTAQFNAARQAQIEALDVPIPKPIKELNEKMKTSSLNEPQSSRQHFSQQRNDNFNQQRNDNLINNGMTTLINNEMTTLINSEMTILVNVAKIEETLEMNVADVVVQHAVIPTVDLNAMNVNLIVKDVLKLTTNQAIVQTTDQTLKIKDIFNRILAKAFLVNFIVGTVIVEIVAEAA
ncbi:Tudor domain-containing protein [Aphelenchoides bicaudatus]|nr:Tudor domain-containing protein [Aphelenchoides bicaudatus]